MSDSFLPSGGVESPQKTFSHLSSRAISPSSGIPRTISINEFIPSLLSNNTTTSSNSYIPSQSHHLSRGPPMSPPKTRSPSAESASAALVEDYRAYTDKMRSQSEGERAHMIADRARLEEVHADERKLWDQEKHILMAKIAELEADLQAHKAGVIAHVATSSNSTTGSRPSITSSGAVPMSVSSSRQSSASHTVPQESGRDANGSPFYAPAPQNPSRTFDTSETIDLRVDSISAPESALRVTSKELTPSDFIRSPPSAHSSETVQDNLPESIDISHIQPGLEGVSIKTSAVSSTFAAKILSPHYSPSKLSPNVKPPPRDITNHTTLSRSSSNAGRDKAKATLDVVTEPENRRLTMYAGHTPNHSLSRFSWTTEEDETGEATPRQTQPAERVHRLSVAPTEPVANRFLSAEKLEDQGDRELTGTLGLTNTAADSLFLAELDEKLGEVIRSRPTSPNERPNASRQGSYDRAPTNDDESGDNDEGPRLRMKASINFGAPLGRL